MEQDPENYDYGTDRHRYGVRHTGLLWVMSNAILTSCQYQNYRRIDLIVIHCSATRATQRYTVDDCRRDHRARGFADIGYTSRATEWFMPDVPSTR